MEERNPCPKLANYQCIIGKRNIMKVFDKKDNSKV